MQVHILGSAHIKGSVHCSLNLVSDFQNALIRLRFYVNDPNNIQLTFKIISSQRSTWNQIFENALIGLKFDRKGYTQYLLGALVVLL